MDTPVTPVKPSIDWLSAARAGEPEALEQLWGMCRDYLRLVAARELSPELRAKLSPSDVVQETLAAAQQSLPQFRGATDAEFHAWLRRILQNHVTQAQRRYLVAEKRDVRRELSLDADEDAAWRANVGLEVHGTPWRKLVANERAVALHAALEKLPVDYRQVIVERAWQRRSFVEIAAGMGRSVGAVRKLWLRGLERIEQEWSTHDSGSIE